MSNIHGFHNLNNPRAVGSAPPSRFGQPQIQGYADAEETTGISMMAPKPSPDGLEPSLSQRLLPGITWMAMTTFITILDIVLFIITLIVGGAKYDGAFVSDNKLGGPSSTTLCVMGGKWEPSIRDGHVWRLFTAILLHAGIMHIASNILFQLRFGYITEQRWGTGRWTGVYVLTGLMASLWSTVMGPGNVSVGASGALFGIIGADFAYLCYNWAQIPQNRMEACALVFVTVITFLMGISGNVDNYAHLGGLVGGLFLGIAMPPHLIDRPHAIFYRGFTAFVYAGMFLLFLLLIFAGNPNSGWPYGPSCPGA
jgi:membrane associated rhomboid family serine protease